MQNHQEHSESSGISDQLPSSTLLASQKVERAYKKNHQKLFAAFENASLRTQQIVTSTTVAIMSALAVVAAIQIFANTIPHSDPTAVSQKEKGWLLALATGLTVGGTTLTSVQIINERINRNLDNLKSQFNALASGNLDSQIQVLEFPEELRLLAVSFNRMAGEIVTKIEETESKLDSREKSYEELQNKVTQIIANLEFNSGVGITIAESPEVNLKPQGTLLDFIDDFHNSSQANIDPEIFLGSSTIAEIKKRQDELQYRQLWLQVLLDETRKELNILSLVDEMANDRQVTESK